MKVELSHDMIAKQVLEKASVSAKARRQVKASVERGLERYRERKITLTKDDLDEIKPYENTVNFSDDELNLISESKKKVRKSALRRRATVIGTIILLSFATVVSIFFARNARINEKIAESALLDADTQAKKSAEIAKKALAKDLIFKAKSEPDRTLAFRIIQLANKIEPENPEILPFMVDLTKWSNFDAVHSNLYGHEGKVVGVAFSPDGKIAATGSEDQKAILWDLSTGRELFRLEGHTDLVRSIAFSSDGETIATGSIDGTIKLWGAEKGNLLRTLNPEKGYIRSVVFYKMDSVIVGASESGMVFYSAETGDPVEPEYGNHPGEVIEIITEPKSGNLVSFGTNGMAIRWMEEPDTLIITDSRKNPIPIWSGSVDLKNNKLALALQKDFAVIKDISNIDKTGTDLAHPGFIYSLDFMGRKLITASSDSKLRLWNLDQRKVEMELTAHSKKVISTAVSPDQNYVLSGGDDGVTKYWHFPEPYYGLLLEKMASPLKDGNAEFMPSIVKSAISHDGKHLAGSIRYHNKSDYQFDRNKGKIIIWELDSGKIVAESDLYRELSGDIKFDPSGNKILYLSGNNLRTFQLSGGAFKEDLNAMKEYPYAGSIACSPDGSEIAVSSTNGSIYLQGSGGNNQISVSSSKNGLSDIVFSNNSDQIFAGEWNGSLKFYSLSDAKIETINNKNISLVSSIASSPDDSLIAIGTVANEVFIWNLNSKSLVFSFQDHSGSILDLQFNFDGKLLTSTSEDKTVKVWDTVSGKLLFSLEDFPTLPNSIFFHPLENKIIIVTSQSVFNLFMDPDSLIKEFQDTYRPGHLTVADLDRYQLSDALVFDPEILEGYIQNGDEEQLLFIADYFQLLAKKESDPFSEEKAIKIYKALEKIAVIHKPEFYRQRLSNFQ